MLFVCWECSTNLIHVKHSNHPLAISPDCVSSDIIESLFTVNLQSDIFVCLFNTISKLASMLESCLSSLHTRITDFCNYNWFKIFFTNYDIEKRDGQMNCPNWKVNLFFIRSKKQAIKIQSICLANSHQHFVILKEVCAQSVTIPYMRSVPKQLQCHPFPRHRASAIKACLPHEHRCPSWTQVSFQYAICRPLVSSGIFIRWTVYPLQFYSFCSSVPMFCFSGLPAFILTDLFSWCSFQLHCAC